MPKAFLLLRLLLLMIASISTTTIRAFISRQPMWRRPPLSQLLLLRRALSGRSNAITEQMRQEAFAEMQRVTEYYASLSQQQQHVPSSIMPILLQTEEDVSAFMADIDTILFDCDGVLYRSPEPIPGAAECIRSLLSQQGKQLFFVTNNAATSRRQLRDKLTTILQLDDDNEEEGALLTEAMMVGSAFSCAQYLKRELLLEQTHAAATRGTLNNNNNNNNSVFVIGSEGLCQELRQAGLAVVSANGDDEKPSMSRDELADHDFDGSYPATISAVVVGHDTSFNFRKLCLATVLLQRNPEALLVATNLDAYDLVGADGRHIPGNGCLVRSIEYASKRTAVNVGKPSQTLMDVLIESSLQQENNNNDNNNNIIVIDPRRSLIVGDRLDTDIMFGVNCGMRSALVLTGVTGLRELQQQQQCCCEDGAAPGTSAITTEQQQQPLPTVIFSHVGLMATTTMAAS